MESSSSSRYPQRLREATLQGKLPTGYARCTGGLHRRLRIFIYADWHATSIDNLMINEDKNNPSWWAFIIDLDLAIKEQREESSGARGKTGTRAFMAIGVLYGEKHTFIHDLESFFWMLFWICIQVVPRFEKWNYMDMEELAELKKGTVADEGDFIKIAKEYFTPHYRALIPGVNRLRKVVFPDRGRRKNEDSALYSRIKEVLREMRKDPKVVIDS